MAKDMDTKIVHEDKFVKYVFSETEMKDMAVDMAKSFAEKTRLDLEKKQVTSQFTADINREEAKIASLSADYNQGYKHTTVPCEVHFDYQSNEVRIYRKDTMDLVKTRTMKQEELQRELFDSKGHGITAPEEGQEQPPEDLTDNELMKDESLSLETEEA